MNISTTHNSLLAAAPEIAQSQIIYGQDLYGDRKTTLPLNEWPHHHRPPAANLIAVAKKIGPGRCLIDIEHGGAMRPNASGYTLEARGDWDFATVASWPNPEQRWADVTHYYHDLHLSLHQLVPGIEIGLWLVPPSQYFPYRELVLTGRSETVDAIRDTVPKILTGPQVMDYVHVTHYVHQDDPGEVIGGIPMSGEHIGKIIQAKMETARMFGLPVVVYIYPYWTSRPMTEAECLLYLQQVACAGADEVVIWDKPDVAHSSESPIVKAVKGYMEFYR